MVATPIGNLDDITLRALKTLKSVHLVAAEDTRRTGNLLRHFQIDVPILSVHEHNERGRVEKILGRLGSGDSVALVTDAGTPGVSDPGAALVAAVREAGFRVEPIPGASAVAAAFSASGIAAHGFTFLGFPPVRGKDRKQWLDDLVRASIDRAAVFFEAPHRVVRTMTDLIELVNRPIFMARELTKAHEELAWGTPTEFASKFATAHGEFTFIVPPGGAAEKAAETPDDEFIAAVFGELTKNNPSGTRREAARRLAEQLGLSTKDVYSALERSKIGRTTE